ncbi:MAG: hypothetical protein P4L57_11405 [Rhizomicrobium sp.]|nr:hypothetical protein [Rhizomicrobium sp.]
MSQQSQNTSVSSSESHRTMAIVSYILLLAGWPTLHVATLVGVVLAYVQRSEARGTLWESHYEAIISTFWIALVVGVIAIPLCFVGVGFLLLAGVVIWFLYRTIRGLIHAIDNRPY